MDVFVMAVQCEKDKCVVSAGHITTPSEFSLPGLDSGQLQWCRSTRIADNDKPESGQAPQVF